MQTISLVHKNVKAYFLGKKISKQNSNLSSAKYAQVKNAHSWKTYSPFPMIISTFRRVFTKAR